MKTIAETVGVARSNLVVQAAASTLRQRRARRPKPEDMLLAEIKDTIAGQPTYGYRRIHALLRRQRREQGAVAVNVKRVYRVMKAHGLLLERHTGKGEERRHDGRVAVDHPDTRWCSDGFEIGCDTPPLFVTRRCEMMIWFAASTASWPWQSDQARRLSKSVSVKETGSRTSDWPDQTSPRFSAVSPPRPR